MNSIPEMEGIVGEALRRKYVNRKVSAINWQKKELKQRQIKRLKRNRKKIEKANELETLLQVEGRGWRVELFADEKSILNVLCAYCGAVCRDAVELDCDHNDCEIFLHCKQCLTDLINNNNGECPINNHQNPVITRNRATRLFIFKSMVLCPYSVEFKAKHKVENDEKEGINYKNEMNGCHFKGKRDELLKNHLSKCIKEENKKLSDRYLEEIKGLTRNNNALKAKNKKLERELFLCKQELNNIYNIYKEEKENNQNHKRQTKQIRHFWNKCGKKMKINGKRVTYNSGGRGGHSTAYSSLSSGAGFHEIKFHEIIINKSNCGICIGISSNRKYANNYCFGTGSFNYGYRDNGYKESHEFGHEQYGVSYGSNDIIILCLDFNNLQISFYKNGESLGVLSKIKKEKYYVAVSMYGGSNGSIEILSYNTK